MTYAVTGAGRDARAVLAAKDIPILVANSRCPTRNAYVGFPSFSHVSGLNRKDCSGSN